MRGFNFYGILLGAIMLLFSCGKKVADVAQNTFYLNEAGGLESLDPAFAKNLSIMWDIHMIFNTLIEVDTMLQIQPSLAKSWEISSDGKTYTFHLRTDVFFQDNSCFPQNIGRKLKAQDVAFSFNRLVTPETASPGSWIFNDHIDSIKPFQAINDSTFIIRLNAPFKPMLQILSMPYCSIIPHEIVEKWGKDVRSHPCGTGPFKFKYWDEGNALILEKNNHYWENDANGHALPYLDFVNITFSDAKGTEFLLFLQHKLDFVNGIDGSFKDLILAKNGTLKPSYIHKFTFDKQPYLNTEYIGFLLDSSKAVMKQSPINNIYIRQAINQAIDRQKLVTYLRNGMGTPAIHGFTPIGMPNIEVNKIKGYDYNLAAVAQLLQKAGFPNGKGLPTIKLYAADAQSDICNFLAEQLNTANIPTKVEILQPSILRQQMSNSEVPMFKAQWIADYPDPETFMAFFLGTLPAPPNYSRINNKLFNQLYYKAIAATNTLEASQLYQQMDSIAMSEAPVIPLYYDEILHFYGNNIKGLRSNALNMIDLKYVRKTP